MNTEEIRKLVEDTAEKAADEAVRRTFLTLGINVDDAIEVQADMRHLRDWRQSVATVKKQGLIAAITVITTGLLGLIWLTISSKNGG